MSVFEAGLPTFLNGLLALFAETVTYDHSDGTQETPEWIIVEDGQADETGNAHGWGDGDALSTPPVEGDLITRQGESDPWRVVGVVPTRAGFVKTTMVRSQPRG